MAVAVFVLVYNERVTWRGNARRKFSGRAEEAVRQITTAALAPDTYPAAEAAMRAAPERHRTQIVASAMLRAVDGVLADKTLDEHEEAAIAAWTRRFQPNDRDPATALARKYIDAARRLRALTEGRPETQGPPPGGILLQRGEDLLWSSEARAAEAARVNRTIRSGAGVSVRLARGVYYRTGVGDYTPVSRTALQPLGRVFVAVTTKGVLVGGAEVRRVPFEKILAVQPASDGLILQTDWKTRPFLVLFLDEADTGVIANSIPVAASL